MFRAFASKIGMQILCTIWSIHACLKFSRVMKQHKQWFGTAHVPGLPMRSLPIARPAKWGHAPLGSAPADLMSPYISLVQ